MVFNKNKKTESRKKMSTETKKYYKYDKIRKFAVIGSGRNTIYKDAIDADTNAVLKFACTKGYLRSANDAPRGGKYGEHYEVLKYFAFDSMRNKMQAERRRLEAALNKVVESQWLFGFTTVSDIGSFKIDGEIYSNYCGDGTNNAEVCAVDAEEFANAEFVSRRQVYNPKAPFTLVKFEKSKQINVAYSDSAEESSVVKVDNALGFAIWERKLKIFTKKR